MHDDPIPAVPGAGTPAPASPPEPTEPDTKDWTWVLERPCPACGFVPTTATPDTLPPRIRDAARRFALALERADAGVRPEPRVWSVIEYGQHVADVMEVMTQRLRLILDSGGKGATFGDWDQDAAAADKEYWQANSHVTTVLLKERAEAAAAAWAQPEGDQWSWQGLRSNGSRFTAASLGVYFAHDLEHHLHDVGA